MGLKVSAVALVVVACVSAPALSRAQSYVLRADRVVPVTLDDTLDIHHSRKGDSFVAHVDRDRDLPRGTEFEGHVVAIHEKRGNHQASIDLEFDRITLPDGTRRDIRAVPISLDKKYVAQDRDGRFTAKPGIRSDQYVIGGTVGGLVIGSLIKKPFEGAFIGALAGIVAAESNKSAENDLTIKSGTRFGALIERDVDIPSANRPETNRQTDRSDARYGDHDIRAPMNRDRTGSGRDDYDVWAGEGRRRANGDRDASVLRISYRDRDLRFSANERPYLLGRTVMVPLLRAADQLGLTVDDRDRGVILVEDDEGSLKLEQDSRNYRLNGKRGSLSHSVVSKDGLTYVPLEVLAEMKRDPILVNGSRVDNRQ